MSIFTYYSGSCNNGFVIVAGTKKAWIANVDYEKWSWQKMDITARAGSSHVCSNTVMKRGMGKKIFSYAGISVVLPPGMIAFCAPEEPDFAFICGAKLAKPPDGKVIAAFRALDLDRGHCFNVLILIIDNRDLVFRALFLARHTCLVCTVDFSDISALTAF
jgi:hypothetical protein